MNITPNLTGLLNSSGNISAKVIHRHGTTTELSGEVPSDGELMVIEHASGSREPRIGDGSTVLGTRMPVVHSHGTYGWTWLYVNAVPSDGETLTIGSDVFEMDTNSSVTEGNIAVDISGAGGDPANVRTSIKNAINNSATEDIRAIVITGDSLVYIYSTKVGTAGNLSTNETFASGDIALHNKVFGATPMVGGTDPQEVAVLTSTHTLSAHDAGGGGLDKIYIPIPGGAEIAESDFETRLINMQASWTATEVDQGAVTATFGRDASNGDYIVLSPAAGSFAANDVIKFVAWFGA